MLDAEIKQDCIVVYSDEKECWLNIECDVVLSRFLVLFINIYDDNDDEIALAVIPLIFIYFY